MKIKTTPLPHHATAISATLALAKLADLKVKMISPLLPPEMETVLAASGGNLLLVPSLTASGGDFETVNSLVALTRTDAIVVRPAVRTIILDLVKHGGAIQWISGCRIWTEGKGGQAFFVHENGDGPAYVVTDRGLAMLPGQPFLDQEDFTAGLMAASTSLRTLMEAH